MHEQEARAFEVLSKHRRALDLVAEALLERETIDGSEVARIVHESLDEGQSDAVRSDDAPGVDITSDEVVPAEDASAGAEIN